MVRPGPSRTVSSMRVSEFLTECHVPHETMVHPPVFTAQRRAHLLHITGKRVIKAVLLASPKGFFLAVLPASMRVDFSAVCKHLNTDVRLAKESEIAETFSDCERGVMVPFGRLYGVKTLLDASLEPDTWIVFEAERHFMTIRMWCRDFEKLEQPVRFAFAVN
jgi:Ala-tRNA(Pro) deacylase